MYEKKKLLSRRVWDEWRMEDEDQGKCVEGMDDGWERRGEEGRGRSWGRWRKIWIAAICDDGNQGEFDCLGGNITLCCIFVNTMLGNVMIHQQTMIGEHFSNVSSSPFNLP